MQFVVDTTGMVDPESLKVFAATDKAVEASYRNWFKREHFDPATVDGRPVRQLVKVEYDAAGVPMAAYYK